MSGFDLPRRLVAEALGTALLVATVVGSGIMAESLTKDVALALLGNTLPDRRHPRRPDHHSGPDFGRAFQSCGLAGLCAETRIGTARALLYVAAQVAGGIAGTIMAHAMFALPLLERQ